MSSTILLGAQSVSFSLPSAASKTSEGLPLFTPGSKILKPSTVFTTRHILYIVIMQCIGPGIVNAALIFGLHVAIFYPAPSVDLFDFPTTMAGDMYVTLLATTYADTLSR